jgi:protein-S-isoprenylcysteine O-methyltransferase Ste14
MTALLRRIDLPPVWGALAACAIWLWSAAVSLAPLPGWTIWPGRALVAAGLVWIGWSALMFLRADTPIEPRRTPRALIADGPFRFTRNPIYRGLSWIAAGLALSFGEASALLVALAYRQLLLARFARPEAAVLEATFGAAYRDWAARVRSII